VAASVTAVATRQHRRLRWTSVGGGHSS